MFTKVVSSDREYLKTLIVSRADFFEIRDKENKSVDDELKLLVNSFGNDRKSYLYSEKYSNIKYNLAIEIIKKHDCFSKYRQTETYINETERLQRLQQLENTQQLENIQQLEKYNIATTTNESYEYFSDVKNSTLYLDPPYQNTTNKYKFKFDSQKFYDWAFGMAKENIVLISSYEISDNRFEEVYSFDKARSTLQGGASNAKCEKLFMVKK